MKAIHHLSAMLCVLLLATSTTQAQFYKDMSIGIGAGAYIYQGDLTPARLGAFQSASTGIQLFAQKPISSYLSGRFNINIARLAANEANYSNPAWRQDRAFSFTTPVKEFTALVIWNMKGNNDDRRGWMPYVLAGAGISFVRPATDFSKININVFKAGSNVQLGIAADIAHGPAKKLLAIPVGLGLEKSISDRFSLQLESSYRFLFNDYLDGVSQAANPSIKDHYHSTTLNLVYKFGKKDNGVGCPIMKY